LSWEPDRDFWRGRGVAVTGGSGFLGSHLVGTLCQLDARVVVVTRNDQARTSVCATWWDKVQQARGNVCDLAFMKGVLSQAGVQTLVHLAAQSQVDSVAADPTPTFDTNIRGTWATLEAVRCSPKVEQTLVASSGQVYGEQASLPSDEEMPLRPRTPYGASKAAAEMTAASYAHSSGVRLAITRCANVYGPGDLNWTRLIPGTVRALLASERPVIRSDGSFLRDFLFVHDGVRAYLQLAENLARCPELSGQAFNLTAEHPASVSEVVDLVQQAVGTTLEPDVQRTRTGEQTQQRLSAAKARKVLGWKPRTNFTDGLERTVAWYRNELGRA
jgi:CDP-glucose 4,6-dehydratase